MAILVTILTDDGNISHQAKMAEDVPLRRLIPAIVEALGLKGQYCVLKHHGRVLSPEETLAAAEVTTDATLELVAFPFVPFSSSDLQNFRSLIGWLIAELQEALERYERFYAQQDVSLTDHEKAVFFDEVRNRIRATRAGTLAFLGKRCPVCRGGFRASDEIVLCLDCLLPMHRQCWEREGCCWVCSGTDCFEVPRPL